ncbi:hypothetical protein [Streptomyces sp. NPDC060366]|uniref:hypothetical protein n=1 Tax=Streptomyces sp. NPDC060366 TaxID=3347105 RepID=UPI00364EB33F
MQSDNTPGPTRQEPAHLPAPLPQKPTEPKEPRFAALRAWWDTAWEEDGLLHTMWEDVLSAPDDGWRHMADWIKTVLAVAGLSFTVLLAKAAGAALLDALHQLLNAAPTVQMGADTSDGVFAVIDQPVRSYLAAHSSGLPISDSTVYTLWLLTGIVGLVLGYLSRNNGVRAMWTTHGAATVFMVWTATPDTGRPVATGLTLLAWTFLSAFAMRGLTLRHRVAAGRPAKVTVQPAIHVHPVPAAPADDRPHTCCPFRN